MPGSHDEFRDLLEADRQRSVRRIVDLGRDVGIIVEAAQLVATDDEHDPEGATIAFERSQTNALLAAARSHLDDVDAALRRIDDGSYGTCEGCGGAVPHERLMARPAARTCIACASRTN